MKYISLNWTLALKFSIGKKKRMRDCRILMAYDCKSVYTIVHTKTTAAKNEVALSYHRVRGLYFLAVVFVRSLYMYYKMFGHL